MYFTTKGDNRVHMLDTVDLAAARALRRRPLHRRGLTPPLTGVDNVIVARSGDVLVAEDGGDLQIVLITPDRVVAPLLQLVGARGLGARRPRVRPVGQPPLLQLAAGRPRARHHLRGHGAVPAVSR